jgi:hypothetical protein
MSETKHTPGPWKVLRDNTDKWYKRRVYAGDDKLVANILDGHEANARLIAAAPDLFDALWTILYADQDNQIPDELFQQGKAAIDKAKGEQQ